MKSLSLTVAIVGLAAGLSAAAQGLRADLLGSATPVTPAQRTIVVNADTKWVNVTQGEVIRFVTGSTEFGWRFDGPSARSFDLQQVAPAGALSKAVTVYIAPTPGRRP